ncbi:hypothetical protein EG68_10548 [Paragonimus skrjabini miyazakii]|uniref:Uncharacterized protein n=1 Tax=Paragonimus skrjabini miyazakii TaxID=59628 RepID=A0A8S9YN82_9TREM|nr:hypothetical protein EG68_10548 [Paragonimus skrjabini miyazakii]
MSDELEGTYGQETQYLMATLGPILRVYVAKLVAKRPQDPIEYLGQCLKHHAYLDQLAKEVSLLKIFCTFFVSVVLLFIYSPSSLQHTFGSTLVCTHW